MADDPKAFISHASEDKADYAQPLAEALLARRIDAWLDKWEIRPGDSLVQKIFEEGLADAGTCVYLMSTSSVDKDWVRAEFENAVAQRIDKKIRLIPVKLEDCNIPNAVNNILWIDLAKVGSIDKVADEIAKVLHGHRDKPPLGAKPAWVNTSTLNVPGLHKQDEVVLGIAFEAAMHKGDRRLLQTGDLLPRALEKGIDEESLNESVDMLVEAGYLEQKSPSIASRHIIVNMYASTLVRIADALGMPVDACQRETAGLLLNEDIGSIQVILERMKHHPIALVDAILDDFSERGFFRIGRTMGGGGSVRSPSTAFKRWFREASM